MQTRFDALIVGAGPAGSTAAILLANAGWAVALIEKHGFPRRKVCGECIAASNLPLLDALGIGDDFGRQAGPELKRVALMRGRQSVSADLPPAADPRHPWGRALGRETLDTLLLARARALGALVLQPWTVEEVRGVAGDHQCTVREAASDRRKILEAPVAIFAHGSWEPLPAERVAEPKVRSGSDLFAFKANFSDAHLAAGLLPMLAFDGGYGGIVLANGGLVTLACCIRADRLETLRRAKPGQAAGEVVEDMLRRECTGVADALDGALRCGPWIASGPLRPGVRLRRGDQAFRIGNAAGEAHPIIGEGMSMALQSAWLLCTHLESTRPRRGGAAQATWQREAHKRYAAEWRQHFGPRLRLAAGLANLAMRPAGAASMMATFKHFPDLLTQGAIWSGKVRGVTDTGTLVSGLHSRPEKTAPQTLHRPLSGDSP